MIENEPSPAPLHTWLAMPIEPAARATIDRVRRAEDVVHVAVMPDVHLANDVCVGTVLATRRLLYPSAVGGDIGCGMLAIGFEADAQLLREPQYARQFLRSLKETVPIHRRRRSNTLPLPADLNSRPLSHAALSAVARNPCGQVRMAPAGYSAGMLLGSSLRAGI